MVLHIISYKATEEKKIGHSGCRRKEVTCFCHKKRRFQHCSNFLSNTVNSKTNPGHIRRSPICPFFADGPPHPVNTQKDARPLSFALNRRQSPQLHECRFLMQPKRWHINFHSDGYEAAKLNEHKRTWQACIIIFSWLQSRFVLYIYTSCCRNFYMCCI